jgi:hypothetical protein
LSRGPGEESNLRTKIRRSSGRQTRVDLPAADLQRRAEQLPTTKPVDAATKRSSRAGLQANDGCDFNVLQALPGSEAETEPYDLISGWSVAGRQLS